MTILEFIARKDDAVLAVSKLLTCLKLPYTYGSLRSAMEDHPDHPTLLSISDVLSDYGVENSTLKTNIKSFLTIEGPVIVQIISSSDSGYGFSVVRNISAENVTFYDTAKRKWKRLSVDAFSALWTGIVLIAEARSHAGERNYKRNRRLEWEQRMFYLIGLLYLPAIILIAVVHPLLYNNAITFLPVLFLLLSFTGLMASGILFMMEGGRFNAILQQFCKSDSCANVLKSGGIRGINVSWSEVGISFFSGSILFQVLNGPGDTHTLFILGSISLLAGTFPFYSVYYQWKVLKKWCAICLLVQVLLLVQFALAISNGWFTGVAFSDISYRLLISVSVSYLLPVSLIVSIRRILKIAGENREYKRAFKQLKFNSTVFDALLTEQKVVTQSTKGLGIVLGNPLAANKIIKVCNPYCGPCAKAHPDIELLLEALPDDLQVQIIFTATDSDNDKLSFPVRHFMALSELPDKTLLNRALTEWYGSETKDYSAFIRRFPVVPNLHEQGDKLKNMKTWCVNMNIEYTPTIFFNGRQLPETYQIRDLKYILSA